MVTRFLAFRTLPAGELTKIGDIGDYLNSRLESLHLLSLSQKTVEEKVFKATFDLIYSEFDENAFRKYDHLKQKYTGAFSIASFEAIALGVGFNAQPNGNLLPISDLKGKCQSIWKEADITQSSGSGVRASTRIPKVIPMGRRIFGP